MNHWLFPLNYLITDTITAKSMPLLFRVLLFLLYSKLHLATTYSGKLKLITQFKKDKSSFYKQDVQLF